MWPTCTTPLAGTKPFFLSSISDKIMEAKGTGDWSALSQLNEITLYEEVITESLNRHNVKKVLHKDLPGGSRAAMQDKLPLLMEDIAWALQYPTNHKYHKYLPIHEIKERLKEKDGKAIFEQLFGQVGTTSHEEDINNRLGFGGCFL